MGTDDPQGTQHRTAPLVGNSHGMTHALESALGPATEHHPQDAALEQFDATHGNQEIAMPDGSVARTSQARVVLAKNSSTGEWEVLTYPLSLLDPDFLKVQR